MVDVGYAHAVVGYGDAGGDDAAEAVGELASGDHTAAALEGKGKSAKFLSRREFVKAAHKGKVEFAFIVG